MDALTQATQNLGRAAHESWDAARSRNLGPDFPAPHQLGGRPWSYCDALPLDVANVLRFYALCENGY